MPAFLPVHIVVYLYILAGVLGAVLGSGLNCLSYRLARGQRWGGTQRSVCVHCGHSLSGRDLIPLLSIWALKGKCRYCGKPIPLRYMLTELLMSLVFVSLLWRRGLSISLISPAVLCCCLFCLSLVDLEIRIIPDRFLLIPGVMRAGELLLTGGVRGLLTGCLPGLILGGGVLALSLLMDRLLDKETMGGGDIKLLAMLGMFFPLSECLLLVFIACLLGIGMASVLPKGEHDATIPFGPALSLAAWFTLLFGQEIVSWYWGLF